MPFLTNVALPQCLQLSSLTPLLLAQGHQRGSRRYLSSVKCLGCASAQEGLPTLLANSTEHNPVTFSDKRRGFFGAVWRSSAAPPCHAAWRCRALSGTGRFRTGPSHGAEGHRRDRT